MYKKLDWASKKKERKKDLDRQIIKGTTEQGKMLMTINATDYFLKSKQNFPGLGNIYQMQIGYGP